MFAVDTLEHRINKAALKKAHDTIRVSGLSLKSIGRIYSLCENLLKEVFTVKCVRGDFCKANVTGFNSAYKKATDLAKTVFLGNG